METDIFSGLVHLGCTLINDVSQLERFLNPEDANSVIELSKVVNFLAEKLRTLCCLEDMVNIIQNPEEGEMFCMELTSFLRELYCPYACLMEGPPLIRLSSRINRLKLINFLVSECEAALMAKYENQLQKSSIADETPTAEQLKSILVTLGFDKPPSDITSQKLFSKLDLKIKEMYAKLPKGYPGMPLLKVCLNEDQWRKLDQLHAELFRDYKLRRDMLLTRLDVTVLSFTWSPNVKTKLDQVSAILQPLRAEMHSQPNVSISHLLSAREDAAFMEKTSSASVREKTKTPLQRLLIGSVPDRGGRPREQRPPAPEMPSWAKRKPDGGAGGGHRGGGRGGASGGRVQGGWNQGGGGGSSSNWNQDQKPQWRGRGRR